MAGRAAPLVVAASAAVILGCPQQRWPSAADRAVLVRPVDDEPRGRARNRSCSVLGTVDLVAGADLGRPALAPREDGGLAMAWVGSPGQGRGRTLKVQVLGRGLDPNSSVQEIEPDGGLPLLPAVAACGDELLVAWQQQGRSEDTVRLAVLTGPQDTPRTDDQGQFEPWPGQTPALACAGQTFGITWTARAHGVQDVFVRWLEIGPEGAGLSEPIRLSGATDSASRPSIACSSDHCGLAWSDMGDGVAEVYGLWVNPGADQPPGQPLRISRPNQGISGAGGAYGPAIARAPRGQGFVVAWHDTRSRDESEIYAAPFGSSTRAGGDTRVSASPAPSTGAVLATCGDASVVAWRDRRYGPPGVLVAAVDHRGRRVSPVAPLSTRGSVETSLPVAACADQAFAIGWIEATSQGMTIPRLARVVCEPTR